LCKSACTNAKPAKNGECAACGGSHWKQTLSSKITQHQIAAKKQYAGQHDKAGNAKDAPRDMHSTGKPDCQQCRRMKQHEGGGGLQIATTLMSRHSQKCDTASTDETGGKDKKTLHEKLRLGDHTLP